MTFEERKNEGGVAEIDSKIQWIFGNPVNDYVKRQIQIAIGMYLEERPFDKGYLNKIEIDRIILDWADEEEQRNSKAFRNFCNDSKFKTNPRLAGNYANITVEDFKHFLETGEMPTN